MIPVDPTPELTAKEKAVIELHHLRGLLSFTYDCVRVIPAMTVWAIDNLGEIIELYVHDDLIWASNTMLEGKPYAAVKKLTIRCYSTMECAVKNDDRT